MKRKQIINVLLSLSMVFMAVMPQNSVSALAAESAESGMTGIMVSVEPEEIGEVPEVEKEEEAFENETDAIETSSEDAIETSSEDVIEDGQSAEPEAVSEETVSEETVPEETVSEEVQRDAMEYGSDDNSGKNEYDLPVISIDDPVPPGGYVVYELPLRASTKVTTTNVASGLKVRWEPVSGAKEYVVYRGSTLIKRTTKTEITDTEVKDDNGKKFTYKVAAVSGTGKISTNVRTSKYYRLLPAGIKSLKSPSTGKMTVTYGENRKGSGYVVRFGLESDMSDAKVITVKDPTVTTKTFTGLQAGKTYYVQARSYKIENGIRYYSGYSRTKTVTIANSAVSAKISFSGSQTIAVGTTRRLYVKDAGSAAVSVTKSSEAVKISKDSTSYIVTGNKAGTANVTAAAGSVKKSFKIEVLSDDQIAQRVYERVLRDCPGCRLWDHMRDGKTLLVSMHIKSIGEGAIASDIRVNLQTGRAEIGLDQDFMDEWNIGVPKSFTVW